MQIDLETRFGLISSTEDHTTTNCRAPAEFTSSQVQGRSYRPPPGPGTGRFGGERVTYK
jgi:hypothetical protein